MHEIDETFRSRFPGVDSIPGMPADLTIKSVKTTAALDTLSPLPDGYDRAFREM
jgi:hypothetical protein